MNVIKLTKKGRPVLVNVGALTQIEQIQNESGEVLSKLFQLNGQYCLVEETLEEIHEIIHKVSSGEKQGIDWTSTTIGSFFDEEERTFQQRGYQQRRPYQRSYSRERNYNQF